MQLSADEAVRMALENNLGIQAERLSPQINTLNVSQARAAYAPVLFSNFLEPQQHAAAEQLRHRRQQFHPHERELSARTRGFQQNVPWGGGRYSFSLDGSKITSSAATAVTTRSSRAT